MYTPVECRYNFFYIFTSENIIYTLFFFNMVQDVTVKTRSENALGVSRPFLYYRKCLDPTDKTTVSTKRNSKFLLTFFFFRGGGGAKHYLLPK